MTSQIARINCLGCLRSRSAAAIRETSRHRMAVYTGEAMFCSSVRSDLRCSRPSKRFSRSPRHVTTNELYVPSESFGGISPEKKAGQALKKLFTFCAARAVMAQLEGSGRGSLASYNVRGFSALHDTITDLSTMDCNAWLAQLAQKDKLIAVRVMEVRSVYCEEEFEWENCKKVTLSDIEKDNLALMRDLMETTATFDKDK